MHRGDQQNRYNVRINVRSRPLPAAPRRLRVPGCRRSLGRSGTVWPESTKTGKGQEPLLCHCTAHASHKQPPQLSSCTCFFPGVKSTDDNFSTSARAAKMISVLPGDLRPTRNKAQHRCKDDVLSTVQLADVYRKGAKVRETTRGGRPQRETRRIVGGGWVYFKTEHRKSRGESLECVSRPWAPPRLNFSKCLERLFKIVFPTLFCKISTGCLLAT